MFMLVGAAGIGILIPSVIGLAGMGAFFGFALVIASKKFRVEVDRRVEEIAELLPKANCGACGFGGCSAYAEALAKGAVDAGVCPASSSEVTSRIAEILGKQATAKEKQVAFLHCAGGKVSKRRFAYDGIATCAAANLVGGGNLGCEFGCTAFNDCVRACPFGAIEIDEIGMPWVNPRTCTGCGICVKVCPRNLLELVPADKTIFVACSNPERGKFVRLVCEIGCIGCVKCVKVCKPEAIEMREGLPVIHHQKCTMCGDCIPVCPKKIIHNFAEPHVAQRPVKEEAA
jgi:RnfABCDGE-type electron transport complex B subunit